MPAARHARIADQIQRELAELVRTELRDPRIGMVTLTGVEVSRDQSHAKVFYTVLGPEGAAREAGEGLRRAGVGGPTIRLDRAFFAWSWSLMSAA